jgi:hypothetical protein
MIIIAVHSELKRTRVALNEHETLKGGATIDNRRSSDSSSQKNTSRRILIRVSRMKQDASVSGNVGDLKSHERKRMTVKLVHPTKTNVLAIWKLWKAIRTVLQRDGHYSASGICQITKNSIGMK